MIHSIPYEVEDIAPVAGNMDIALLHQEIAHHISLSRQAQGQFHDSRTYQLISHHSAYPRHLRWILGQSRTENDWLSFIRSLACGIDFLQLIISKYLGGICQHFEMTICQLFEDIEYLIEHIETTLACCVLFLSDDEQGLLQAFFSIACFVSFSERLACSVGIFQSIPRVSSRMQMPPSASG